MDTPASDGPTRSLTYANAAVALRANLAARTASARALEEALVRAHLKGRATTALRNRALNRILTDTSADARSADKAVAEIPAHSTDDLVRAFQILSTPTGTENTGVVFTPQWIAVELARQAITARRIEGTVIDPACGCGALLIAALRHLHRLHAGSKPAGDILSSQLFGVDIDADALRRARLLLAITAIELGDDRDEYDIHLDERDSLDPVLWPADVKFDAVIANPPYVRYQELTEGERARLRARWSVLGRGNFNVYYAFFELARTIAAPGGSAAFITPNSYIRSASAKPLRQWMTDSSLPNMVIDFKDSQVFDGALTYVAITVFDAEEHTSGVRYATCNDAAGLATLSPSSYSTTRWADLPPDRWNLVSAAHQASIAALSHVGQSLGEVADIRYGVATLRDRLFLLDENCRTFSGAEIEHAATVPVVRVSSVASQEALDACETRLLFPYTRGQDGRPAPWTPEELDAHPAAAEYLRRIREELALRDKGRKEYPAWFAYGRSQGLRPHSGPRLLSPLYAARPRFLLDALPDRLFMNGVSVTPRAGTGISVELLAAVMNSGVLHYYIAHTSTPIAGGYYSYQKGPLSGFHISDAVLDRSADIIAANPTDRDVLLASLYGVKLPA